MSLVCHACGATNRVPDARSNKYPLCGKCGAEMVAATPVAPSDAVFARYIPNTEMPMLVDFWTDRCGPCKTMAPHFANAATQLPEVGSAEVDTEACPHASAAHAIRSILRLILFRGGKELAHQFGAIIAGDLARRAQSQLASGG